MPRAVRTTAVQDAATIRDAYPSADLVPLFRNLNNALVSVREVWEQRACWTRVGAAYLGIPFVRPRGRPRW